MLFKFVVIMIFLVSGIFSGYYFTRPKLRSVDSTRVENCLHVFIEHRKSGDEVRLRKSLDDMKVAPKEFEGIIDRFIHYRMCNSSMNQAFKLLEAFKGGYNITPEKVFSSNADASFSFRLDAEILKVFQEKPELVNEAFGG